VCSVAVVLCFFCLSSAFVCFVFFFSCSHQYNSTTAVCIRTPSFALPGFPQYSRSCLWVGAFTVLCDVGLCVKPRQQWTQLLLSRGHRGSNVPRRCFLSASSARVMHGWKAWLTEGWWRLLFRCVSSSRAGCHVEWSEGPCFVGGCCSFNRCRWLDRESLLLWMRYTVFLSRFSFGGISCCDDDHEVKFDSPSLHPSRLTGKNRQHLPDGTKRYVTPTCFLPLAVPPGKNGTMTNGKVSASLKVDSLAAFHRCALRPL